MSLVVWMVDNAVFIPLAREYHNGLRLITFDKYNEFLHVWAKENDCTFSPPNLMRCSEEAFVMFKLRGIVLYKKQPMWTIVDEFANLDSSVGQGSLPKQVT